jgi:hypothetical protein
MNKARFVDESGVERFGGTLELEDTLEAPAGVSGRKDAGTGSPGILNPQPNSGNDGGDNQVEGGTAGSGGKSPGAWTARGATVAAHGRVKALSNGTNGAVGEVLVPDGLGLGDLVFGGLIIAAGVPAGAPDGKLPIAIDTTAVTGGIYGWNGAAWVKAATI